LGRSGTLRLDQFTGDIKSPDSCEPSEPAEMVNFVKACLKRLLRLLCLANTMHNKVQRDMDQLGIIQNIILAHFISDILIGLNE
jgi:hypothetical protein